MRRGFFAPLVLASTLVLSVGGCTWSAEIATDKAYDPSDGVGATMGDVALRNVLLITNDDGVANLVLSIVNSSGGDVALQVQYESGTQRVSDFLEIASSPQLTRVGDDPTMGLLISGKDVIAGSLVPLYFQYADVPGELLFVPVLDGSMPQYELLVP
ncbi:MAG: hypothetical protein ACJAV4_000219 [Pontimonas sp.]